MCISNDADDKQTLQLHYKTQAYVTRYNSYAIIAHGRVVKGCQVPKSHWYLHNSSHGN